MENIFTASNSFLVYAKFLGLFPMTLGGNSKGNLKLTTFNAVLTLIAVSTLTYLLVINIIYKVFVHGGSQFVVESCTITLNSELASFLVLYAYQTFKRNNITKMFENIRLIDEQESFIENVNKFSIIIHLFFFSLRQSR